MPKLDYSKIFIKEACPTSIGGQAVMEGVMMQGPDRTALAMRLPSGELYLKTSLKPKTSSVSGIPLLRGVAAFVRSFVSGMSTLMESADILEQYAPEMYSEEPGKLEKWVNSKFGDKAAWNFMMTSAVVIAILISVIFFVILPTWLVNFLGKFISSSIILNLFEGLLRIAMFVGYVAAIRRMEDIKTLFRYHGAEHKSIHCFENGLELTPENAAGFYTLHPRCGTSFMVFVLIISLLLFSFLGWPDLFWRIASRILLIPVIAGLSYELLKWAGRSDSKIVKLLSWPGLMLQKLTTDEPTNEQLEVGLLALKAVLVDSAAPVIEGFVDRDGNPTERNTAEDMSVDSASERSECSRDEAAHPEMSESSREPAADQEAGEDSRKQAGNAEEAADAPEAGRRPEEIEETETAGLMQRLPESLAAAKGFLNEKLAGLNLERKKKELAGLRDSFLNKLHMDIIPKTEAAPEDDLWGMDSEVMKKKIPEGEVVPADEAAVNEAIRFLNELDKDGYTIVAQQESDGITIAEAIADHFTEDAKARTLARRYTNDISTVENALKWGQAALGLIDNGKNEALMIMSYATGLTRTELITRGKELMKAEDFRVFEERIQSRLTGTPIQYILGMTEFMGLPFRVNDSVLIPRFDTETVVEEAVRAIGKTDWPRPEVLDLCTGSGAIGISVAARVPEALVTMTDVSEAALHTAMNNAGLNGVNRRCIFLLGDMFDAIPENKRFDVIVSNPPYIETDVIETLAVEVKDHEPRKALDGGRDGLDFYRVIARDASAHLKTGGYLVLEIGADQAGSVKRLLAAGRTFEDIHKVRDLAGHDRCIIARRV